VLPQDVRQALEIRWEARLAFDLLPPQTQRDCLGWIEAGPDEGSRHRRIDMVLDSLRPGAEVRPVEQRHRHRLNNLSIPAWRARAATSS
jgi:hypothetical protein